MRVGHSGAAGLMAILTGKKDTDEEGQTRKSFADLFANIMEGGLSQGGTAPAVSAAAVGKDGDPTQTATPFVFNTRTDTEYLAFRDKASAMRILEVPDEYFDVSEDGTRTMKDEAWEYLKKTRIDNARAILPASIEDAQGLYSASRRNLDCFFRAFVEDSGMNMQATMQACDIANYNHFGMFSVHNDADIRETERYSVTLREW